MKFLTYTLGVGLLICSLVQSVKAQALNYKIASVFIYNFTNYIQWPEHTVYKDNEFVIGVLGNVPEVVTEFERMASAKKAGHTHPIKIQVINKITDAQQCHILFIPYKESEKIASIGALLQGKPILIITEKPGLIKQGAQINFFIDGNDGFRTKFEMNPNELTSHGLKVAAALARLAKIVED